MCGGVADLLGEPERLGVEPRRPAVVAQRLPRLRQVVGRANLPIGSPTRQGQLQRLLEVPLRPARTLPRRTAAPPRTRGPGPRSRRPRPARWSLLASSSRREPRPGRPPSGRPTQRPRSSGRHPLCPPPARRARGSPRGAAAPPEVTRAHQHGAATQSALDRSRAGKVGPACQRRLIHVCPSSGAPGPRTETATATSRVRPPSRAPPCSRKPRRGDPEVVVLPLQPVQHSTWRAPAAPARRPRERRKNAAWAPRTPSASRFPQASRARTGDRL
jgi:hypothetical protein